MWKLAPIKNGFRAPDNMCLVGKIFDSQPPIIPRRVYDFKTFVGNERLRSERVDQFVFNNLVMKK